MQLLSTLAALAAVHVVAAGGRSERKLSFETWHADEEIVVESDGHGAHEHHGEHHNCIHDEIMEAVGHDVHEAASSWVVYETQPVAGRALSASYQPIRIAVNIERLNGEA